MTVSVSSDPLLTLLPQWQSLLQEWSLDGSLTAAAQEALVLDREKTDGLLQSLVSQWSAGNFQNLPPIVLLSAEDINGALGAYATSTGTIYINEDWLESASPDQVYAVLTEELGHHLDGLLNEVDTPGDEGEYIARLLNGLSRQENTGNESDSGAVQVNRYTISVEASTQASSTWIKSFGGASFEGASAVGNLSDGAFIITGYYGGTSIFDGLSIESRGEADIFIAKIDADGAVEWLVDAGSIGADYPYDVATYVDGSSVITGYMYGTSTFGDITITSPGGRSGYAAKLNADGSFAWATSLDEIGQGVDSLVDGSSIITGQYYNESFFGQGAFIAKLNPDGSLGWTTTVSSFGTVTSASGINYVGGQAIAAFNDGSSLITGSFNGTAAFGETTLSSAGDFDIFVAKVSADGTIEWATRAGGASYDGIVPSIALLEDGSCIITGNFEGTASFGSTTLQSEGQRDTFIAKLNEDGSFSWATSLGGSLDDSPTGIVSLIDGSAVITGSFSGTATFGATTLSAAGSRDIFLAKLNADGSFEWATRAGGAQATTIAGDVAAQSDGSFIVTGSFSGEAQFGDSSLIAAGDQDVFVAKLNPDGTWGGISTNDGGDAVFSISGATNPAAPAIGETLSADLVFDDPDGNGNFSYQWQLSTDGTTWSNTGTDSNQYTLSITEEGKQIQVIVSYNDGEGFAESVTVAGGTVPYDLRNPLYDDGDTTQSGDGSANVAYRLIDNYQSGQYLLVEDGVAYWFVDNYTTADGQIGIGIFANDGTGPGKSAKSDSRDNRDELKALITTPGYSAADFSSTTDGTYTFYFAGNPQPPSGDPTISLSVIPSNVSEDGIEVLTYTFSRTGDLADALTVNFALGGNGVLDTDYTSSQLTTGASQFIVFNAGESTATVLVDPTADSTIEPDVTVEFTLQAGSGYVLATTTPVIGAISDDDGVISFSSNIDGEVLNATAAADTFKLDSLTYTLLGNPKSPAFDSITGLDANADSIDAPSDVLPKKGVSILESVSSLKQKDIKVVLTNSRFAANDAVAFTFIDSGLTRTFLALNDSVDGFNASTDAIIEITGYSGFLSNLNVL
jgi:hypothetical protein